MPSSIVESLALHTQACPDKLCLVDGAHAYTYAQTWDRVRGCCEQLRASGVQKSTSVMVECNQDAAYLIAMLGVHLAGGVAVPLERNAALERFMEIASETDAKVFIGKTQPENTPHLKWLDSEALDEPNAAITDREYVFPESDDVAEILFSTGTTGKSKGIVISHRNNMAIAENVIVGLEMKPDNVEIIPMPLSHSHGLRRSYSNFVNGSTVVVAPGALALKKIFNLMDEYHVTSMDLSPSILSIIFKLSRDRVSQYADVLDYIQLGSAPLPEEDKERLRALLPATRLYNFYGSTEAGCSCLLEFSKTTGKPGCIGKPAVNSSFVIVDAERHPIESSETNLGFLASSGDVNMVCYLNEPELTAQTMEDGVIYTKDLGYIDEEGFVYMLGREDDVINFGGVKVSPEEIESAVAKHPLVVDCACIPIPDKLCGQVPILCIVVNQSGSYDAKDFKQFLSTALDANKQPQRIELLDEIPRTFNGKIKRKELIAHFSEPQDDQ